MDFKEARAFLESLVDYEKKRGYPTSLEPFLRFLSEFGNPHRELPPTFLVVGTKGKGSTAAFLTGGLMSQGFRVGMFTSPHLVDIRERITINFEKIPEEKFAELVESITPHLGSRRGIRTFFETLTLMSFLYFTEEKVDYVVLEAGLGGRLDATNVVDQRATVITPINYDHTDILGDTLDKIAMEKSAVIKSSNPVFSAYQQEEAEQVIRRRTKEMDAPLYILGQSAKLWDEKLTLEGATFRFKFKRGERELKIPLLGRYQVHNAALAAMVLEEMGLDDFNFDRTKLRGRLEILSEDPLIVVDGAHNPFSIRAAMDSIEELFFYDRIIVVFGISSNKDLRRMLDAIDRRTTALIATRAKNPRALDPWEIAEAAQDYMFYKVKVATEPEKALDIALKMASPNDLIFVTGSFYLVGDIISCFDLKSN